MRRPRGPESIDSASLVEMSAQSAIESNEQIVMEAARRQEIGKLWKQYNFPGQPPLSGSEAERRMLEAAQDYVKSALGVTSQKETASDVLRHASEINQREKHNELSIMIYGLERTMMSDDDPRVYKLADFAAGIAYPGNTLEAIRRRMKQGRNAG